MSQTDQIERLHGLASKLLEEIDLLRGREPAPQSAKPAEPSAAALERVARLRATRERRRGRSG